MLGISNPTYKDEKKLLNYLKSISPDISLCYYISKNSIDSLKQYPYKPNWQKGFRPIQFKVFNSSGKLICQYSPCEGDINKLSILKTYPPKNIFPLDSNYTFFQEIRMIHSLCKTKPSLSSNGITIVVYWGTWLGKPGKNLLKRIYNYYYNLDTNYYPVKIIPVNLAEINPKSYYSAGF